MTGITVSKAEARPSAWRRFVLLFVAGLVLALAGGAVALLFATKTAGPAGACGSVLRRYYDGNGIDSPCWRELDDNKTFVGFGVGAAVLGLALIVLYVGVGSVGRSRSTSGAAGVPAGRPGTPAPNPSRTCLRCGTPSSVGQSFCGSCGQPLQDEALR